MDINEFNDKKAAGTLTRRDITRALAAAGIGMAAYPVA
jgi:hypothetical protein